MNKSQLETGPYTQMTHQKEDMKRTRKKPREGQQDPWTKQEDCQLICLSRHCRDIGDLEEDGVIGSQEIQK